MENRPLRQLPYGEPVIADDTRMLAAITLES